MRFRWNSEKNKLIRHTRGIDFEEVVAAVERGDLLADIENPGDRFPHQRILVVAIDGYAIVVPYVEDAEGLFLKTAYPSRKLTRLLLDEAEE